MAEPHSSGDQDTGNGCQPNSKRSSKLIGLKVTAALKSVNLFAKPILLADQKSERDGRWKTYIFVCLFCVTCITLIAYFSLRDTVAQSIFFYPTLAEYQQLLAEGYSPTCPCQQATYVGSGASVTIPDAGNCTLNLCSSLISLGPLMANATPMTTDAANLFGFSFLTPMYGICLRYEEALNAGILSASQQPLGLELLAPESFNATAYAAFVSGFAQYSAGYLSILNAIRIGISLPAISMINQAAGATNHTPVNCSCDPARLAQLPPLQTCRFRISFDTRPVDFANNWWTCSADVNFIFFPVALFLLPSFYESIGVPPDVVPQLVRFAGSDNITMDTRFLEFVWGMIALLYPPNAAGSFSLDQLQPGIYAADFERYFAACRPSTCTITYTSRPSALAAITTALGVISGVQAVLHISVDYGCGLLFAWLDRQKANKQKYSKPRFGVEGDRDSDSDDQAQTPDADLVAAVGLHVGAAPIAGPAPLAISRTLPRSGPPQLAATVPYHS